VQVESLQKWGLQRLLLRIEYEVDDPLVARLDYPGGFPERGLLLDLFLNGGLRNAKLVQLVLNVILDDVCGDGGPAGLVDGLRSDELLKRDVKLVVERITPVVGLREVLHRALEAALQELFRHVQTLQLVHGLNLLLAFGARVLQRFVLVLDPLDLPLHFFLPVVP
jgi:hypothetical protein